MLTWALWILLGGIVVLAFLSPLESLRWWVRDGQETSAFMSAMTKTVQAVSEPPEGTPRQFIVYLSGVGAIGGSAESNSKTERHFLNALHDRLDGTVIGGDIFPYSAANLGLPERKGGTIWKRAARGRSGSKLNPLPWLINLRNVFQVLVAADPRYGPTYGLGLAQVILDSIREKGYVPNSSTVVTIIGYSGGAQMALNAAWFLGSAGIPTQIVSMGGVFSNHSTFDNIQRFVHIYGERDMLRFIGPILSPGRWKWNAASAYNRAKAEGRVVEVNVGPMSHDVKKWYLDHKTFAEDGRSYFDITVDTVVSFLDEAPPTAR